MAMKEGEQLLLIEGGSRYARQVRYFREAMFRGLYNVREPLLIPHNR
jgi:hypothetical protein